MGGRMLQGGAFQMLVEDSAHFGDAERVPVRPVIAGDDEFALRAVEVAAPVGDDAIRADRGFVAEIAAFAAVAEDGVVGNPRC